MTDTHRMRLDHDSPDGMCVMARCQFQAEATVSWLTSAGSVIAPLCRDHMRQAWERTVPGHTRDTFTIWPLGGTPQT